MSVDPAAISPPDRVTAMSRTDLLNAPGEEGLDRLGRLACRFLDAPVALISLVDEHGPFMWCLRLAEPGPSLREMPLPHPFCRRVQEVGAPLVIHDARAHPLEASDLAIEGMVAAAYMGVPLLTPEGNVLGSFCVLDVQPHHWTDAQLQVLADLAACVQTEFRLRGRPAEARSVARSLSASSLEDGIVVNARDSADRREFEAALQERETRFRRLTENSSDLVQIIHLDGRMGYTGPSVVHLLGYTPEEVAGLSIMDFIHPDDQRAVAETMEAIFSSPGASRSVRYRVRHKDGGWRVFEAFGRTLLPDSSAEGLVCNARDVTERHEAVEALRRSEEHFRRLIENAYDVVLVMDAAGTITYASPSAQRVLGSAPEELTGLSGFSLVHPDDVDTASPGRPKPSPRPALSSPPSSGSATATGATGFWRRSAGPWPTTLPRAESSSTAATPPSASRSRRRRSVPAKRPSAPTAPKASSCRV